MHKLLNPHPNSFCLPMQICVEITHAPAGFLGLSYTVAGNTSSIQLPPVTTAMRSDTLWQHTCFEAFVRGTSGTAYYEFNFAPSTQWAAYRFSAYRSGMTMAEEVEKPAIQVKSTRDCYTLETSLQLNCLSALPLESKWHLGLAAVIEDARRRKSYWALAHPPGNPDFHHPDCFAYEFSPFVQP